MRFMFLRVNMYVYINIIKIMRFKFLPVNVYVYSNIKIVRILPCTPLQVVLFSTRGVDQHKIHDIVFFMRPRSRFG